MGGAHRELEGGRSALVAQGRWERGAGHGWGHGG